MKPLSKLNLISGRLQEITAPQKGIFATLFGTVNKVPKVDLRIQIPQYEFLRAEMFVEDLMELCDYEISLQVDELIAILFKDFLTTIARGAIQKQLMVKLMEKRETYFRPTETVKEYVNLTPNHLRLSEQVVSKKVKWVVLQLEVTRKTALRGEVFLMDLMQLDPKFQMSLEELISVLFIDFVVQLKAGNDGKMIQNIINNLSGD